MMRFIAFIQFLPLTIFLFVMRSHGFTAGFEVGALAAAITMVILLYVFGKSINRLNCGVNLFLIFGGAAFYFQIEPLLNFFDSLREAALIFFIGVTCIVATLSTPTGVFENFFSQNRSEKKYSIYYIAVIAGLFVWSFNHRGITLQAGVIPVVLLIFLKQFFQRKLSTL